MGKNAEWNLKWCEKVIKWTFKKHKNCAVWNLTNLAAIVVNESYLNVTNPSTIDLKQSNILGSNND